MQAGELLIEHEAQPRQFVRIAELLGTDGLVEFVAEGAVSVVLKVSQVSETRWTVRPGRLLLVGLGLHEPLGLHHVGLARLAVAGVLLVAVLALVHLGGTLVTLAVLGLAIGFALVVLAFGFLFALGLLLARWIELEVSEQLPYGLAIGLLIGADVAEMPQVLLHPRIDRRAPEIDHRTDRGRRHSSGHGLAGQDAQHLRQGDLLAGRRLGITTLAAALLEQPVEIFRHPGHLAHADRLVTGLLDRVEDLAGERIDRSAAAVQRAIMVTQAKRHRTGAAAHLNHLSRVQIARRRLDADLVSRQALGVGGEGNSNVFARADRAHGRTGDPAEALQIGFALIHGASGLRPGWL